MSHRLDKRIALGPGRDNSLRLKKQPNSGKPIGAWASTRIFAETAYLYACTSDQTFTDQTFTDQTFTDQMCADQAFTDQAFTDQAFK